MGGNEHLLQIIIQVMLGLALFSFLEYSIRTANAPAVVNRRAKLICAAGLSLSVIGMVVLMYHAESGIAMIITGSAASVLSMMWLEARAKAAGRTRAPCMDDRVGPASASRTHDRPRF